MIMTFPDTTKVIEIYLNEGKIVHSGLTYVPVSVTRQKIVVGCTSCTVEAMEFLLAKHKEAFKPADDQIKIQ